MTTTKWMRRYGRSAQDFALGLAAFSTAALTGGAGPCGFFSTAAHARRFEEEILPLVPVSGSETVQAFHAATPAWTMTHQVMVFATLAIAFASMFALNLWFARHVRRVHGSIQRRR